MELTLITSSGLLYTTSLLCPSLPAWFTLLDMHDLHLCGLPWLWRYREYSDAGNLYSLSDNLLQVCVSSLQLPSPETVPGAQDILTILDMIHVPLPRTVTHTTMICTILQHLSSP